MQFYQGQARSSSAAQGGIRSGGQGHSLNGLYPDQELDPTRHSLMKVVGLCGAFLQRGQQPHAEALLPARALDGAVRPRRALPGGLGC